MKKVLFISICVCMSFLLPAQKATKPRLMVMPSDAWCNKRGYVKTIEDQGETKIFPDYKKALQSDIELIGVIAKIGSLMIDRGFPLVNLDAALKSAEKEDAIANMTVSKTSGAALAESPADRLKRAVSPDIVLELTWEVHKTGPKKSVEYILSGKDAYKGKEVAIAKGIGTPSFSAEVPLLLEEAVIDKMDGFVDQLQGHFEDMVENGREVRVEIKVFDNGSGIDLENEYGGEELTDIIDNWMAENTVKHSYNFVSGSESYIIFDQVRIPLFMTNGRPMDTRRFVGNLRKFLSGEPYKLTCKVDAQGLGYAVLIIGEK